MTTKAEVQATVDSLTKSVKLAKTVVVVGAVLAVVGVLASTLSLTVVGGLSALLALVLKNDMVVELKDNEDLLAELSKPVVVPEVKKTTAKKKKSTKKKVD